METSKNLDIWNKLKQPPPHALKTIKGGRLSGMTDVNPQWRYKAMTEQFGVCGEGWSYEIVRVWNEPLADGQVLAFAEILLHVRDNTGIPGIGGSMLVSKESAGLHANDEGYKMAITDALGTAMKMLGVAADIYAGLWDGTKYKGSEPAKPPATKPTPQPVQSMPEASSEDLSSLVFPDAGKLLTYLTNALGMNGYERTAATAGYDLTTEQGRKDCWVSILKTRDEK